MKRVILFFSLLVLNLFSYAQTKEAENKLPPILLRGKIVFERNVNQHKQLDEMAKGSMSSFAEQMKKKTPKYKTDIFEMQFNDKNSIYKPAKDGISESKMMFGGIPAERNIVFNDYTKNMFIANKEIYDKTVLLNDSMIHFKWKIKEEYRTIAGYNCRRAETIIMDSVYVIAYFADGIVPMGGPESFNGLPGMILGVVMPRLNYTLFATKIEPFMNDDKEIIAPTKGTNYKTSEFKDYLQKNLKQWGQYAERVLWYTII